MSVFQIILTSIGVIVVMFVIADLAKVRNSPPRPTTPVAPSSPSPGTKTTETKPAAPATPSKPAKASNPLANVQLQSVSWSKSQFNVMKIDATIQNNNDYPIKDMKITCDHSAPSGTVIDSNTRTIYELVRAGQKLNLNGFDMGFIHEQAKSTQCQLVSVVRETAPVDPASIPKPDFSKLSPERRRCEEMENTADRMACRDALAGTAP